MSCSCTPEWPCSFHGSQGRDADVPSDVLAGSRNAEYFDESLRRPYPRESEHSDPWPWTPPVELRIADRDRDRDQRARPAAVALKVPKIEILREARRHGANRFEVEWWFKDGTKQREVFTTVGWAERKVASVREKGVWRTIWRNGQPARFQDQVVDVEVSAWYGQSDRMKTCLCGCREQFLPARSDQMYVDERHRSRASTRAARARARV